MSTIDLHIHSNISRDGEYPPETIVSMCRTQQIKLAAVTDHNSVRGVSKAIAAADGIRIIPGVELDCTYEGRNFHLLGYGFDYTCQEYDSIEQDILRQEKNIAEEKVRLFRRATGLPVNILEVLSLSQDGVLTAEMIAEFVLSREYASQYRILHPYLKGGEKSDMPNVRFYWDFFSEGKAAWVPVSYISLPNAVSLIHRTGGVAVLAHPGQNLGNDTHLLPGIVKAGIDGIEAYSSYHSASASAYYAKAAKEYHLFVTCGSDFHGRHKPQIFLGGHGSPLDDQELLAGLPCLFKQQDVRDFS